MLPPADLRYLHRCYDLARRAGSAVYPNPPVGALLVHHQTILSEAHYERYGGPHAEARCIEQLSPSQRQLLPHSTLYVSLEPSSHHDQTPPGVDLLLQHRIPRVVVGTIDPNPLVAGRGIARLRAAGVMVVVAPDPRPALHLLGGFALRHREKRPQVLLKYAQSHDGFMGLPNRPVWLSNAYSKRLVHRWRSRIDAILIGTNTAHCDNPRLTTRLFPGPSPLRIVLDRRRRLSPKLHLFTDGHPTLLVTERSEWTAQWSEVPAVEVLHLPFDQTLLPRLLGALLERGIDVVMVEGGARLLGTFIEAGLWDEARVFTASAALGGGIPAPSLPPHYLSQHLELAGDQLDYYRR